MSQRRLWGQTRAVHDVRANFDAFVEEYGHFMVYRRYNQDEHSRFFNPVTQEGVGGGRYTYTDEIILARHDPVSSGGTNGLEVEATKFFLHANDTPKRGDIIVELQGEPHTENEALYAKHEQAYRVVDLDKKRADGGQIAFYTVFAEPHFGPY